LPGLDGRPGPLQPAALSGFFTAGLEQDLYSERTVVRLTRMLCADNARRAYHLGNQM